MGLNQTFFGDDWLVDTWNSALTAPRSLERVGYRRFCLTLACCKGILPEWHAVCPPGNQYIPDSTALLSRWFFFPMVVGYVIVPGSVTKDKITMSLCLFQPASWKVVFLFPPLCSYRPYHIMQVCHSPPNIRCRTIRTITLHSLSFSTGVSHQWEARSSISPSWSFITPETINTHLSQQVSHNGTNCSSQTPRTYPQPRVSTVFCWNSVLLLRRLRMPGVCSKLGVGWSSLDSYP